MKGPCASRSIGPTALIQLTGLTTRHQAKDWMHDKVSPTQPAEDFTLTKPQVWMVIEEAHQNILVAAFRKPKIHVRPLFPPTFNYWGSHRLGGSHYGVELNEGSETDY